MHLPFGTMGSGSLAATGVLETKYRDNMSLEDAQNLCIEAIEAGIFYDLGSGSNVDLCVIQQHDRQGKVTQDVRSYHTKAKLATNENTFPKGTSEVMETIEKKWTMEVVDVEEKMDIC
jgi:20S proteasome subunit beta 2